jgi:hypothetical protein
MSKFDSSIVFCVSIFFLFRKKLLLYRISNRINDKTIEIMKSAKSNEQEETTKKPIKSLKRLYLSLENDDLRKQFEKRYFIDLFSQFSIQIPMYRLIEYMGTPLKKDLKDHYSIDLEDIINQRITKFNNLLHASFFTYQSLSKEHFDKWFKEIRVDHLISYSSFDFLATLAKETPKEMAYREKLFECLYSRIENDDKLKYSFKSLNENKLSYVYYSALSDIERILFTFNSCSNFYYFIKKALIREYFQYLKSDPHTIITSPPIDDDNQASTPNSYHNNSNKVSEDENNKSSDDTQIDAEYGQVANDSNCENSDNFDLYALYKYLTLNKLLFTVLNDAPHKKLIFWMESAYYSKEKVNNVAPKDEDEVHNNQQYTSQVDHALFLKNHIDESLGTIWGGVIGSIQVYCEKFVDTFPDLVDKSMKDYIELEIRRIREFDEFVLQGWLHLVYKHRHYIKLTEVFPNTRVKDMLLAFFLLNISLQSKVKCDPINNQISKWNLQIKMKIKEYFGIKPGGLENPNNKNKSINS